jgi:hypothetical protein
MLANIKLNPGVTLDPLLAPVVEKLALKHPGWVFRSGTVADDPATGKQSSGGYYKSLDGDRTDAFFTRTVTVLQDGLLAGRLSVDRSYSTRSHQEWHFVVKSARINNGRKGDTVNTRDAAVAVRTVSRMFLAPSLVEMVNTATLAAHGGYRDSLRDLERPIERGQYSPSVTYMQIALYKMLKGIPFDERELRDKLLSDKYEEALANFELAQHMRVLTKMKGVIAFRGQYAYLTTEIDTDAPAAEAKPFEELPQSWQDKIAVLQLMQDNEVVLDVGFRLNESTFLIVE